MPARDTPAADQPVSETLRHATPPHSSRSASNGNVDSNWQPSLPTTTMSSSFTHSPPSSRPMQVRRPAPCSLRTRRPASPAPPSPGGRGCAATHCPCRRRAPPSCSAAPGTPPGPATTAPRTPETSFRHADWRDVSLLAHRRQTRPPGRACQEGDDPWGANAESGIHWRRRGVKLARPRCYERTGLVWRPIEPAKKM